jgi:hypothetical protein
LPIERAQSDRGLTELKAFRDGAWAWRQSFVGARHSKFHFIDERATAPHHLQVELDGEKPLTGSFYS